MQDMRSLTLTEDQECATTSREEINWKGRKPLPSDIADSLASISVDLRMKIPGWILPKKVLFHNRWTIRGRQFSTSRASRKDSIVFFELASEVGGVMVPGLIRDIFSVHCRTKDDDTFVEIAFLAIHTYNRSTLDDPFLSFPEFGTSIWSANLADRPVVIPTWRRVYHAISRQWDKSSVVLKALDRVSRDSDQLRCAQNLTDLQGD